MTPDKKFQSAMVDLVINQPFFGVIALRMPSVKTDKIDTMATDGVSLFWCEKFVDEHSKEELVGVLIHEIMHVIFEHQLRRKWRDHKLFNVACDYAINLSISKSGLTLPSKVLLDEKWEGYYEEKIYDELDKQVKQSGFPSGWENMPGEVLDSPFTTEADIEAHRQKIKEMVASAAQTARMQGKMPGGMDRILNDILEPQLPWKEILARFITSSVKNDYTWKKPNRRYMSSGAVLPTLESPSLDKVVYMVDTSGSISEEDIRLVGGAAYEILSQFNATMTIIYCDAAIAHVEELTSEDPFEMHPKGGGGTDFVPPFVYVEENMEKPAVALYITDGYCDSFPEDPGYPVLWIRNSDNERFNPPFGEVIRLNSR